MIKVTRKGVFETNSSSTHSITVADEGKLQNTLPNKEGKIIIFCSEFGWEYNIHTSAYMKLSYLITNIFMAYKYDRKNPVVNIKLLPDREKEWFYKVTRAVEEFTGTKLEVVPLKDDWYPFGYIDHQSANTADDVLNGTIGKIKRFIFNPLSKLIIDNDNHE
jgi:hypothetical protein